MRNAAAPSVGGEMSAPMPAAERIAPATSGTIARAAQQRPRDRAQHHGRGHAAARHCAEQKSGDGHCSPGAAPERDRPIAAIDQSMKKRPAPDCSSTAP